MMLDVIKTLMDSRLNQLRSLPPAQRFQIMAGLSMMWTTIFCAGIGVWFWYGQLLTLHILVAFGVAVTSVTFYQAEHTRTYRDSPRDDGTARYDDVWGA